MSPRHLFLRFAMRTVGRLSDGIRLGFREGFDSGSMVDYVYRARASGITPLGRLIDRSMLRHPVWAGVRARRELLIGQLRAALAASGTSGPSLFDMAAGPGSYLLKLQPGELWAADIDPDEVRQGEARAAREGRSDIRYVVADAFDPATWPRRRFDVLVASGFFDILVDGGDVERLLDAGTAASGPGARWVFTVMERHPDLALLRDVLVDFNGRPWEAVTRSADEVLSLAEARGWRLERIEREGRGFFAVATMVRR